MHEEVASEVGTVISDHLSLMRFAIEDIASVSLIPGVDTAVDDTAIEVSDTRWSLIHSVQPLQRTGEHREKTFIASNWEFQT